MADYQARIDLLVGGQQRLRQLEQQLEGIEGNISGIERRWRAATAAFNRSQVILAGTGRDAPRGPGGRFARDPERAQRLATLAMERRAQIEQRLSRLAIARARVDAKNASARIASQNRVNNTITRQITLESKLNSATELYNTNLRKFQRGGGGAGNQALQDRAQQIQAAFQAFESGGSRNLRLVRALATELGRVVEAQNELNRAQALSSKGFEAGRRLQERLDVVSRAGNISGERVRSARSLATQAIAASRSGDQATYAEAIRRATAATSRLERESRDVALALAEQERETRRTTRATEARRRQETRDAQARRRQETRQQRASDAALQKRIENVALGAGFPLLFGGGPGAVLGGALGGIAGGFGAQIILSAFGQIVDKFVAAAAEAGDALRKPIESFEELIRIGGLAGTAVSRQVRVAEFLGIGEVGAAGVARAARSNIGAENVSALVEFAASTERLSNTFAIFDTNLKALLARGLTPVTNALDDFLKGLTGLRGSVDFADVDKIRFLEDSIAQLEKDGASGPYLTNLRKNLELLQEQNARAQEYKDLQDQIKEISDRVVSNAKAQARYEQDRLGLTRLVAASRQGQLAVDQASLELQKLQARLTPEVVGAEREILEILIKQAEARKEQAEAARLNAVEETRRQLERERLQREVEILNLKDQTRSVIINQAQFERGLLATFDSQEQALRMGYENKRDALELERQSALIGVNELDVQREINVVYQRRGLLLRQQSEFALRQLEAAGASAAIGEARFGNQLRQQRLEAGGRAASVIQAADPTPGLTAFFGGSEQLRQQQLVDFNVQLGNMNNQLKDTEDIINSIDFQKLSFTEQQGLERQAENLRNSIAAFREYQPAINEAALLQQRFQDALRLTQPAIQVTTQMLDDFANTAVTGNEAVAKALRSFAQILMQEAVRIIASYAAIGIAKAFAGFSGGGGTLNMPNGIGDSYKGLMNFADGGNPPVNRPSIVGEEGPELFVPRSSGTIIPNDKLGGGDVNSVVNVTISDSGTSVNAKEASQLGRVIESTVVGVIQRERRPGGILSR